MVVSNPDDQSIDDTPTQEAIQAEEAIAAQIDTHDAATEQSLWRVRGYIPWFTADTASSVGTALRTLAISLIGYTVSGSTVAAGWLGTAAMIAQQGFGLVGGTFVDRHDRKPLIIANAISGVIAWGTVFVLLFIGQLTFPVLLIIGTIASGISGFLGSATDAMLRSLIPINNYPTARSLNEGRDATIAMAGGPVGGFLYGLHPWLPFLGTALAYAVTGVAALRIPRDHIAASSGIGSGSEAEGDAATSGAVEKQRSSFIADFAQGWRWSLHRPLIIVTLISVSLINFGINGIQYAIQLHLIDHQVNATYIGIVSGAISAAMLIGAFVSGIWSKRLPVGRTVCIAYIGICLCAVPMLLSDSYGVILLSNTPMGLPFPIINALLMGFIFAKAPDTMQGRITVTLTVPAQILSTFCSAAAGMLLPRFAFRGTIAIFFAAMVLGALISICYAPLRRIPDAAKWEATQL